MRINIRLAVSTCVAAALLALASGVLLNAIGFGIKATEVMVNPNAQPGANVEFERAADLAFNLFLGAQLALACVVVGSGVLEGRLHWLWRAVMAVAAGIAVSYGAVMFVIVFVGGLPRPLEYSVGVLGEWIQQQVRR